jgi:predicted dehydrogenase
VAEDDGLRLFLHERGAERVEVELERVDPLAEEVGEFISCIRTGGLPEVDGEVALQTVRVLEAVVESIRSAEAIDLGGGR